jgi:23S rRNA pseudouridine1911/1915/1917 synthase
MDVALIRLHPELSRRKAREVIEKGQVLLEGLVVRQPGRLVQGGATIEWDANRRALPRARLSLPILYQDEALLVVDKPAGLLVVPSGPGGAAEDTAFSRVLEYARHLEPRRPYAGLVHRLDRDTSGALAFALRAEARRGLIDLFREHRIERRYAAIVEGRPAAARGIVDAPIADAYRGGRRRIARPTEEASPAVTLFTVQERFRGAAWLDVQLETGRQHQIRLHLAHLGLPVLGDRVYRPRGSGPPVVRVERQMLHARLLALRHPLTGEMLRVESPLPRDFQETLAVLRRGSVGAEHRGGRRP